nr:hypothetical protein [Chloroflexia bacterium]
RWERVDGTLRMEVEIPSNTTAEVWIPGGPADRITEGGAEVSVRERRDGAAIVDIGSGTWEFSVGTG